LMLRCSNGTLIIDYSQTRQDAAGRIQKECSSDD
jgi:hypothetical protein